MLRSCNLCKGAVTLMRVPLAGEIQSEDILGRLTYYIPSRGDPKRMKVGISLLPAHLYMGDKCQRQDKAHIMKDRFNGWKQQGSS